MPAGRRKEFNEEIALKAAMETFWQKGFVGASLSDLTSAMGITKPSMYSSFGNKESLFILARDYYLDNIANHILAHLNSDKPIREKLKGFLTDTILKQCDSETPKGCFVSVCNNEAESGELPEKIEQLVRKDRDLSENTLLETLQQEKALGNLPEHIDPQNYACLLMTFLNGCSAQSRSGKSNKELLNNVDLLIKLLD